MTSTIDLHMHSTISDGTDLPEILLDKVVESGIRIFSLTDHDAINGCGIIQQKIVNKGLIGKIQFISGVEFTCKKNDLRCHILGYNFDLNAQSIHKVVSIGDKLRFQKFENRIRYLRNVHKISFTDKEMRWLCSLSSVGKPHIAQILVKKGLATSVTEAIKKYIDGCPNGDIRQDADNVVQAIIDAGGTAVWAHPLGGEGEIRLSRGKFEKYLYSLMDLGIKGLECYYSRYSMDDINYLQCCAEINGLYISGGSDYHGETKGILMGVLNNQDIAIDKTKLTILKQFY